VPDPEPGDFEREVESVVRAALAPFGEGAAEVEFEWSAGFGGWFIEVTPRREGAASVSVGCDWNHEVLLSFGHTRLELWNTKRGPTPVEALSQYLPAIFSGDFEEAGFGDDRFARVNLPNGKTARVGALHPPLPWALRRRHRYAPYS
jgi:hypothetical protein